MFSLIMARVLKNEGGYVYDPDDPGGETNYGISKRAFPDVDIKNLTEAEAKEIYRVNYWNKIGGDQVAHLDAAFAYRLMDAAVNVGVRRAVGWLQEICGTFVDGEMGPITMSALKTMVLHAPKTLDASFQLIRVRHYTNLANGNKANRKYLLGWLSRTLDPVVF